MLLCHHHTGKPLVEPPHSCRQVVRSEYQKQPTESESCCSYYRSGSCRQAGAEVPYYAVPTDKLGVSESDVFVPEGGFIDVSLPASRQRKYPIPYSATMLLFCIIFYNTMYHITQCSTQYYTYHVLEVLDSGLFIIDIPECETDDLIRIIIPPLNFFRCILASFYNANPRPSVVCPSPVKTLLLTTSNPHPATFSHFALCNKVVSQSGYV